MGPSMSLMVDVDGGVWRCIRGRTGEDRDSCSAAGMVDRGTLFWMVALIGSATHGDLVRARGDCMDCGILSVYVFPVAQSLEAPTALARSGEVNERRASTEAEVLVRWMLALRRDELADPVDRRLGEAFLLGRVGLVAT